MEPHLIFLTLLGTLALVFLILLPFIIGTVNMTKRFNSLEIGMPYEKVMEIMGLPKNSHTVDDTIVCTWRKTPIRGYFVIRTAYFKNGVLHSVSHDGTYS